MKPKKNAIRNALFLAVSLALSCSASTSFAKDDDAALEKLGSFKRTDAAPMKRVAQDRQYAENLRKVLQQIRLPEGFKIDLFAIVPDAPPASTVPTLTVTNTGLEKKNFNDVDTWGGRAALKIWPLPACLRGASCFRRDPRG